MVVPAVPGPALVVVQGLNLGLRWICLLVSGEKVSGWSAVTPITADHRALFSEALWIPCRQRCQPISVVPT